MADTMGTMIGVLSSLEEAEYWLRDAMLDSLPLSEKWGVSVGIAEAREKVQATIKHINWLMSCHGSPTSTTVPPAEASAVAGATSASHSPTWTTLSELDDSE